MYSKKGVNQSIYTNYLYTLHMYTITTVYTYAFYKNELKITYMHRRFYCVPAYPNSNM